MAHTGFTLSPSYTRNSNRQENILCYQSTFSCTLHSFATSLPAMPPRGRTPLHSTPIRRAPAACLGCRKRKVRCDATANGRCTNCRLDGLTNCVIRPNNTPRFLKILEEWSKSLEPHPSCSVGDEPSAAREPDCGNLDGEEPTTSISSASAKATAACYHCRQRRMRCDATILGQPCTNCRLDDIPQCVLRHNSTQDHDMLSSQPQLDTSPNHTPRSECSMPDLPLSTTSPQQISRLEGYDSLDLSAQSSFPESELRLLVDNGCFSVPAPSELDEFVRQYLQFIHPSLPILAETQLWELCHSIDESSLSIGANLSAFLLQALLLASCPVRALLLELYAAVPNTHLARIRRCDPEMRLRRQMRS